MVQMAEGYTCLTTGNTLDAARITPDTARIAPDAADGAALTKRGPINLQPSTFSSFLSTPTEPAPPPSHSGARW